MVQDDTAVVFPVYSIIANPIVGKQSSCDLTTFGVLDSHMYERICRRGGGRQRQQVVVCGMKALYF